jgi:hypothetical protein
MCPLVLVEYSALAKWGLLGPFALPFSTKQCLSWFLKVVLERQNNRHCVTLEFLVCIVFILFYLFYSILFYSYHQTP